MQDARFSAQLKSAKLTARSEADKTIRRVQFALARDFSIDIADWLGPVATNQRELLVGGDIDKVEIPIDAYHAKATLSGMGGNAEVAVDGISAAAVVKQSGEDQQTEEVTLVFEAFPEAKLLTFLAASVKEHIDCTFMRSQLTIEKALADPGERLTAAVEDLAGSIPKGSQMTFTAKNADGSDGKSGTLEGTGEPREGVASSETTPPPAGDDDKPTVAKAKNKGKKRGKR